MKKLIEIAIVLNEKIKGKQPDSASIKLKISMALITEGTKCAWNSPFSNIANITFAA